MEPIIDMVTRCADFLCSSSCVRLQIDISVNVINCYVSI